MDQPGFSSILVPVDFLDMTEKVLEHALDFARLFNARVILLHVVHVPPLAEAGTWLEPLMSPAIEKDLKKQLLAAAEERLKKEAERFKTQGIEAEAVVKVGNPVSEILSLAKERAVDLIIMGSQGRTGIHHFLVGSTTERVVRRAPCHVLCLKPSAEEGKENEK